MKQFRLAFLVMAFSLALTGCKGCDGDDNEKDREKHEKAINDAIEKCMWDETGECQKKVRENTSADGTLDPKALEKHKAWVDQKMKENADNPLSDYHTWATKPRDPASESGVEVSSVKTKDDIGEKIVSEGGNGSESGQ